MIVLTPTVLLMSPVRTITTSSRKNRIFSQINYAGSDPNATTGTTCPITCSSTISRNTSLRLHRQHTADVKTNHASSFYVYRTTTHGCRCVLITVHSETTCATALPSRSAFPAVRTTPSGSICPTVFTVVVTAVTRFSSGTTVASGVSVYCSARCQSDVDSTNGEISTSEY